MIRKKHLKLVPHPGAFILLCSFDEKWNLIVNRTHWSYRNFACSISPNRCVYLFLISFGPSNLIWDRSFAATQGWGGFKHLTPKPSLGWRGRALERHYGRSPLVTRYKINIGPAPWHSIRCLAVTSKYFLMTQLKYFHSFYFSIVFVQKCLLYSISILSAGNVGTTHLCCMRTCGNIFIWIVGMCILCSICWIYFERVAN